MMEVTMAVVTAICVAAGVGMARGIWKAVCKLRLFVKDTLEEHSGAHFRLESSQKNQIKRQLLDDYYAFKRNGGPTVYQKEAFISLYEDYVALQGNSFVTSLMQEVESMEVIIHETERAN